MMRAIGRLLCWLRLHRRQCEAAVRVSVLRPECLHVGAGPLSMSNAHPDDHFYVARIDGCNITLALHRCRRCRKVLAP